MTVGKIGGRRLPLVAADLLKFTGWGRRRYAGPVAQLLRSEAARAGAAGAGTAPAP